MLVLTVLAMLSKRQRGLLDSKSYFLPDSDESIESDDQERQHTRDKLLRYSSENMQNSDMISRRITGVLKFKG